MDIFKLVGSVFVDTDEANKSLSKTGEQAEKTSGKLGGIAATAGKVALGVGAAVGAVGAAMVKSAKDTSANLDVIDKASQRMKVSAESYQELAHAAELSGVEMTTLEKAAKKLEGTDLNMDDALEQIYALGTAEERSAKAAELFGDAVAYQMTPMLNASAEEMENMKQEARDLGLVMSEDTVKAGAEMNDAFTKVEESFGAITNQIGAALMPIVAELLDWVLEHMPEIQAAISNVAEFIQASIPVIMEVIETLRPYVEELFKYIGILWENVLKPVLTAVIQLLQGDFKGAFESVFKAIENIVKGVFNGLVNIVKVPLNAIIEMVNNVIDGLNNIKVPDWVPVIGGAGINISPIPLLAKGGDVIDEGQAIVGEAGAELISLPKGARVTPLTNNGSNNSIDELLEETKQTNELLSALINTMSNRSIEWNDRELARLVKKYA